MNQPDWVIQINDWVTGIHDNLQNMEDQVSETAKWEKRSIHKVPYSITQLNETAYTPRMVSFGPYHYDKEHLRQMEEHKSRALLRFVRRSRNRITDFHDSLARVAQDLKECYNPFPSEWEGDANFERFLPMIMLDGCFMLEILHFANNNIADYAISDPIFSCSGKLRIMPFIRRDMLMLENQLPMLLLLTLGENGVPRVEGYDDLNKLILKFYFPNFTPLTPTGMGERKHVLDVFRKHRLQGNVDRTNQGGGNGRRNDQGAENRGNVDRTNQGGGNGRRNDQGAENGRRSHQRTMHAVEDNDSAISRSAIELNEAGIRFEKSNTMTLTDIKFNCGILSLPIITVNDTIETMFLNLMAFERFNFGVGNEVTSYIVFMDSIIDSERDVALLHSAGIIRNAVGSDRAVAEMFNSLSRDATLDRGSKLDRVQQEVTTYCKKPWNKWRASLIHNYFINLGRCSPY